MTATLVYNLSAGYENRSLEELMRLASLFVWKPRPVSSDDDQLEEVLAEAGDCVVVAGGDGTVAKVALALRGKAVPIAILPTGGSNNIARFLDLTASPEKIAAGLGDSRTVPLDIGLAEGAWGSARFVEAAGLGALTEALCGEHGDAGNTEEKLAVGRAALRDTLMREEACNYRFAIDGQEVRERLALLEVLNIASIGPQLELAPEAHPGDSLLHVVSLSPEERPRFLRWLDKPAGAAPVTVRPAREVRIEAAPDRVRIDDPKRTRSREGKPVRLTLDRARAEILVPAAKEQT